ncbi:prepilin-type N-terminal cleavage/methylation domain-containing protein [Solibacillus silvestris]
MFNTLKKRIKNEKGLSLVELLAVIVILAIVAAIAIPAIGNIIENSRIKAAKADAISYINAANIYYSDGNKVEFNSTATGNDKTKIDSYIGSKGTITEFKITKDMKFTGKATKSGVNLVFTDATIETINAESSDLDGTTVKKGN